MARRLTDNQKVLAFIGGGAFLSLLAGGGIWWATGLVEDERAAIESEKRKIQQAETKIKQIPELEKQVIILRENVEQYVKILPDQDQINAFLRTVNKFVSQSGVDPKSFIDGKPGATGKFLNYSYRIECTASLWQLLKFMNLFENYERFVRVKNFSVKAAGDKELQRALSEGRDAKHTVSLVVETYVYRGGPTHEFVTIPNYKNKREKLREEISFHTLQLDRYDYRERIGRRDIFVDPRPTFGGGPSNENPESVQRKILDQYITDVDEIRKLFELWRDEPNQTYVIKAQRERELKAMLADVYPRARESSNVITHGAISRAWNRDIMEPLREISDAIDPDTGRRLEGLAAEDIEDLIARMRQKLKRGDLTGAKNIFETIGGDRIHFEPDDPRYPIAQEATAISILIERALEFSDKRIEITGVVVNDAGRSGLLVNGTVYEEGDYLDDNTLLKSVARESAEFIYRGYSIVKTW